MENNQKMTFLEKVSSAYGEKNIVYDEGLRKHMLNVYNLMASGVMLTFIVGMGLQLLGMPAAIQQMPAGSALTLIMILAPLPYVFFMGKEIQTGSLAKGRFFYWSFCVLMGLSMAFIFERYTGASIAMAFLSTSVAFAGLSLYGYTTKSDLSPYRSFFIMAVWGLIAASLINIFFGADLFSMVVSAAAILIFSALTAIDTQQAKAMYREGEYEMNQRAAIWSAMELYLDFINLMIHMLRFVGIKKD